MSTYEPDAKVKKAIIENELRQVYNSIYHQTITVTVAKRCDDKEMLKRAEDTLVKLEKMKYSLEEILKELECNTGE